jgi:hypothetical protein
MRLLIALVFLAACGSATAPPASPAPAAPAAPAGRYPVPSPVGSIVNDAAAFATFAAAVLPTSSATPARSPIRSPSSRAGS